MEKYRKNVGVVVFNAKGLVLWEIEFPIEVPGSFRKGEWMIMKIR